MNILNLLYVEKGKLYDIPFNIWNSSSVINTTNLKIINDIFPQLKF